MSKMLRTTNFKRSDEITLEELKALAPAIFAKKPSTIVSERYRFISTIDVVEKLLESGFKIVAFQVSGLRKVAISTARDGFQRHMIRFRRSDEVATPKNGVLPEVVLINAHDGSSPIVLCVGLFRLVCLNGMIIPYHDLGKLRVRHHQSRTEDVVALADGIIKEAKRIIDIIPAWGAIELDRRVQLKLAHDVMKIRFPGEPFEAKLLLEVRRPEDEGNDLWKVFNRLQENITRGGIEFEVKKRKSRTRNVNKIEDDVKYNMKLYELCAKLAVKGGDETAKPLEEKSLEDLTGPELVARFNSLNNTGEKVTRFATRAAGIKRIKALQSANA